MIRPKRYIVYEDRRVRDLEDWLNRFPGRLVHIERLQTGEWFAVFEVSWWLGVQYSYWEWSKKANARVYYVIEYWWARIRNIGPASKAWLRERLK